jgi:hypothetical protein
LKENGLLDDILAENSKIDRKGREKSPLFFKSWGARSMHRAHHDVLNDTTNVVRNGHR